MAAAELSTLQKVGIGLGIISTLIGIMNSPLCKKPDKEDQNKPDSGGGGSSFPSCAQSGGILCSADRCTGTSITAGDTTPDQICCTGCGPPGPGPPTRTAVGGDDERSCASQQGVECSTNEYCPGDNWIDASDSRSCCELPEDATNCVSRIQDTVSFQDLGTITVERFPPEIFGVWFGEVGNVPDNPAIGTPNYAPATATGNNVYTTTIREKEFTFRLLENTESSIEVSPG